MARVSTHNRGEHVRENGTERNSRHKLAKTMVCKYFLNGTCERGEACNFHHGFDVHQRPNLIKTKLCFTFMKSGHCNSGMSCRFAHGHGELCGKHRQKLRPAQLRDRPRTPGLTTQAAEIANSGTPNQEVGCSLTDAAAFAATPELHGRPHRPGLKAPAAVIGSSGTPLQEVGCCSADSAAAATPELCDRPQRPGLRAVIGNFGTPLQTVGCSLTDAVAAALPPNLHCSFGATAHLEAEVEETSVGQLGVTTESWVESDDSTAFEAQVSRPIVASGSVAPYYDFDPRVGNAAFDSDDQGSDSDEDTCVSTSSMCASLTVVSVLRTDASFSAMPGLGSHGAASLVFFD